jgi:hypothetical protein
MISYISCDLHPATSGEVSYNFACVLDNAYESDAFLVSTYWMRLFLKDQRMLNKICMQSGSRRRRRCARDSLQVQI